MIMSFKKFRKKNRKIFWKPDYICTVISDVDIIEIVTLVGINQTRSSIQPSLVGIDFMMHE